MNKRYEKRRKSLNKGKTQGDDRRRRRRRWMKGKKMPTKMKRSTLNLFVAVRVFVCLNGKNVAYENKLKQVIRA